MALVRGLAGAGAVHSFGAVHAAAPAVASPGGGLGGSRRDLVGRAWHADDPAGAPVVCHGRRVGSAADCGFGQQRQVQGVARAFCISGLRIFH